MCEQNTDTNNGLEKLLEKYMTRCALYERALYELAFDAHYQNEQAEASNFAKFTILSTH